MEIGQQTKEEAHRLRSAVVEEGLMESLFDLLRRVPRRMLMVFKVNDLTRCALLSPFRSLSVGTPG